MSPNASPPGFTDTDHVSYWLDSLAADGHPPLSEDGRTQVAVVGAGIVGVTSAYLLAKAGVDVTVLERFRVAERDTGHTTAHLSHVVDTDISRLVEVHGEDAARSVWDGNRFAIDLIDRIRTEAGVDCDFERVDGFLYAPGKAGVREVRRTTELARRIGYPAEDAGPSEVPFDAVTAVRFPEQARFHPVKYVRGLVDRCREMGVTFHEDTEVAKVDPEAGDDRFPAVVETRGGATLMARHVILATHVPFVDRVRMFTRLYPYRSYVIGARVEKGAVSDALWWDTESPFHYARLQPMEDADLLIWGGADHKTGHARDAGERWAQLEADLRQAMDVDFEVAWRWSAQDPQTQDGLPYIGRNPGSPDHELIATGFGGSGMTYGTLAAWMLSERVQGRTTAWDDLFDPNRFSWGEIRHYLQENVDYPKHLVKGYMQRRHGPALDALQPGDGTVLTVEGRKVAVSRDRDGRLHAVSAACTHLGCAVRWNAGEESWDCPCHGSRFARDGTILNGPAPDPLAPVDADALRDARGADAREREA